MSEFDYTMVRHRSSCRAIVGHLTRCLLN